MTKAIYFAGDKYTKPSTTLAVVCRVKALNDCKATAAATYDGAGNLETTVHKGEILDCYGVVPAIWEVPTNSFKVYVSVLINEKNAYFKYGFIELKNIQIIN